MYCLRSNAGNTSGPPDRVFEIVLIYESVILMSESVFAEGVSRSPLDTICSLCWVQGVKDAIVLLIY